MGQPPKNVQWQWPGKSSVVTATSCWEGGLKNSLPSLHSFTVRGEFLVHDLCGAKIEKHELWTRSSGRSSQHLILGFLGLVLGSVRVLISVSVLVLVTIPVSVPVFLVPFFLSLTVPVFLGFSRSVLLVSPLLISISSVPVLISVLLLSVSSFPFRFFRMLQNKIPLTFYRISSVKRGWGGGGGS